MKKKGMEQVNLYGLHKSLLAETTTPLSASGTYTGTSTEATEYDRVIGIVYSDQDGTLYIDYSIDGTNWDYSDAITVTGGTAQGVDYLVKARYIRVRYVNGSTDQTVFRLQIYLKVL